MSIEFVMQKSRYIFYGQKFHKPSIVCLIAQKERYSFRVNIILLALPQLCKRLGLRFINSIVLKHEPHYLFKKSLKKSSKTWPPKLKNWSSVLTQKGKKEFYDKTKNKNKVFLQFDKCCKFVLGPRPLLWFDTSLLWLWGN